MRRTTLAIAGAFTLASAVIAAPPALAADPAKVTITLGADRTTVDADHRDAKISGLVTAGAENKPVAGVKVDLSATGHPQIEDPVTDAEGKFAATYSSPGVDGEITAKTDPTAELEAGAAGPLAIRVAKATTRMSLETDKPRADAGVPFTIGGLVEYESTESTTGWKPLAGAAVRLKVSGVECGDSSDSPSATTGKDGRYAVQTKLNCTSNVNAEATVSEPWFQTTTTSMVQGIEVRPRTFFGNVQVTMDPYGLVKASGAIASSTVYREFYGKQILLERSWNGRSWWTHRALRADSDGRVSTRFTVNQSSYWRFRFAGASDAMPSTSKSVKTWRWTTKMSKISVSPGKVRRLKYVTAKGSLVRYSPTHRKFVGYGGQKVRIIFRYKGKKTWYHLAWAKTDRKGRFSKKVRAYGDGYYASIFHGAPYVWASGSPNDKYVDTYGLPGSQRQAGIQSFLTPFTPPLRAPSATNDAGGTARIG
ncbi:hypothetical protein SMC26_32790 [Actinomadura fulvescens]|uniref:Carboxypeptidase regulatory-like domain-containing protein n=1 Tax=Actinomadura fulvescens TaxID=46160 RepID=A0ABP6CQW8_9ACTN